MHSPFNIIDFSPLQVLAFSYMFAKLCFLALFNIILSLLYYNMKSLDYLFVFSFKNIGLLALLFIVYVIMCSLKTLLTLTALCAGMYFDMNYCLNVQCERDTDNGIAIKHFQGEMNLRKHFGFCSNKKAIVLTFKYCKVEQFIMTKDMLQIYYPNVRTIVWQCIGKCIIEENKNIANIYGCEKGKHFNIIFFFVFFLFFL